MKSLAWLQAENDELVRAAADKRAASIRRLKRRIERVLRWDDTRRAAVNTAIDAWVEAESRRG